MQITVDRAEFAESFRWTAGALSRRPVVPVLAGVLVAVKGALVLSAFDYKQSRRGFVSGHDAEAGKILVDGSQFKKIVTALPKTRRAMVELTADDKTLTVASEGRKWTLSALPLDEYPALPEMPPVAGVIEGEQFAKSVLRVAAAAGRDDTMPSLTCIQFEPHSAALGLAATDRYRLAVDEMSWTPVNPEAEHGDTLACATAVVAFARRAGKYGKVSVHLADNLAGFSDDAREMTIQPNEGTFPRIGPLLRTENEYTLTADAHALAGAVRRIGGMVERNMPVILRYAGKTVEVFAYRDGDVAATETMTAEATVDSLEVQFNPGYLAPMLECFDGQVTLGFVGEALNKPKPVTLDSPEADTFRALVVPIKR